jgi:hypothetical protein
MRLASRSGLIAIVLTVAAIAASTAQASAGLAGIRPVEASPVAQSSADQAVADRAALSPSAPLDRFSLIHVHTITPTTKGPSAQPDNGFDWGDAAIGAAAGLTLTMLVGGGAILLSRRSSPRRDRANVATA